MRRPASPPALQAQGLIQSQLADHQSQLADQQASSLRGKFGGTRSLPDLAASKSGTWFQSSESSLPAATTRPMHSIAMFCVLWKHRAGLTHCSTEIRVRTDFLKKIIDHWLHQHRHFWNVQLHLFNRPQSFDRSALIAVLRSSAVQLRRSSSLRF